MWEFPGYSDTANNTNTANATFRFTTAGWQFFAIKLNKSVALFRIDLLI